MSDLPPTRKFATAGFVLWAEIRRDADGVARAVVILRNGAPEAELSVQEAADLAEALGFNATQATALLHLAGDDDLALRPHEGRA